MACYLSIYTPAPIQSPNTRPNVASPALGAVRIKESIAVDGTSSGSPLAGECFRLYNAETTAIMFAYGSTPLAITTTATGTSSAGIPVAPGQWSDTIVNATGALVQVKALA